MSNLTLTDLKRITREFIHDLNTVGIPELYGATDGKRIGTYVEHAFHDYLRENFDYTPGNSASGVDFPELEVDLKVTSIKQPQSSSPFRDASQKVYGLGYHLLVLVYDKADDHSTRHALLNLKHAIFIAKEQTADFQTTSGLIGILQRDGNRDDIIAFLEERNLPLDEIGRANLADRILHTPPQPGCLTISNALQWRLQYNRAIVLAGSGQVENLLV